MPSLIDPADSGKKENRMKDFNPNVRLEKHADKFEIPVSTLIRMSRTVYHTLASGETIRGLDLSHWQKDENINFVELKANDIDFVILKVTEGTSFVDDTFKAKYEAALEAGLIVMPYHFFRGIYGGSVQAKHCVDTLRELGFLDAIDYVTIIWADVESSDGVSVTQRRNRLLAFLQTIESLGFQGGVYSSPYYWNSLIGLVGWIANYWQWDAHWTSASIPTLPLGWSREKTIVWQNGIHPAHSWVETVVGATGNVDHNYFYGSVDDLKEILKFPVTPPSNGDCNCQDEIARLEEEVNFLKLEIYDLQQKDITLDQDTSDLTNWTSEQFIWTRNEIEHLDNRLLELETLREDIKELL